VVDKLAWWTEDGSSLARFAPQTELFLNDPVREAEQHRLFLSLMTTSGPARHNEDIARTPLERTVSDDRTTIAFETDEHRRVGASVRTPTKVLGQQLHESGNRRHRVPTRHGIDVTHLVPVTRMRIPASTQVVQ